MQVVYLKSGENLEQQLRRLQLRKKRKWYNAISRKQWFIIGGFVVFLTGGCLVGAVVLASNFISIGGI